MLVFMIGFAQKVQARAATQTLSVPNLAQEIRSIQLKNSDFTVQNFEIVGDYIFTVQAVAGEKEAAYISCYEESGNLNGGNILNYTYKNGKKLSSTGHPESLEFVGKKGNIYTFLTTCSISQKHFTTNKEEEVNNIYGMDLYMFDYNITSGNIKKVSKVTVDWKNLLDLPDTLKQGEKKWSSKIHIETSSKYLWIEAYHNKQYKFFKFDLGKIYTAYCGNKTVKLNKKKILVMENKPLRLLVDSSVYAVEGQQGVVYQNFCNTENTIYSVTVMGESKNSYLIQVPKKGNVDKATKIYKLESFKQSGKNIREVECINCYGGWLYIGFNYKKSSTYNIYRLGL